MSSLILDYEGSAEGEAWKVFMDNIYVNWNRFEAASHRSLAGFYGETYQFHRESRHTGHLIWTGNNLAAAAIKESRNELWIGAFSFSEDSQSVGLTFDKPNLPIVDDQLYRMIDPVYSSVTGNFGYYFGSELKDSNVRMVVPYTDRVKYLILEKRPPSERSLKKVFGDSFRRIQYLGSKREIVSNYAFGELKTKLGDPAILAQAILDQVMPAAEGQVDIAKLSLKRVLFHAADDGSINGSAAWGLIESLRAAEDAALHGVGEALAEENKSGAMVFLSAEADPFSKSGGLANVLYEISVLCTQAPLSLPTAARRST